MQIEAFATTSALHEAFVLHQANCEGVEEDSLEAQQEKKETGTCDWPLEFTPEETMQQLNFWLLYFIFGIGSACGLLFLNNAGKGSSGLCTCLKYTEPL